MLIIQIYFSNNVESDKNNINRLFEEFRETCFHFYQKYQNKTNIFTFNILFQLRGEEGGGQYDEKYLSIESHIFWLF